MLDANTLHSVHRHATNQSKKCPLHIYSRVKMNSSLQPSGAILKSDLNSDEWIKMFKLRICILIQLS